MVGQPSIFQAFPNGQPSPGRTLLLGKEITLGSPPLRMAKLKARPGKLPTSKVTAVPAGSAGWQVGLRRLETMGLPSGKHTKNYGKSPFFMGKSTISMDHVQ